MNYWIFLLLTIHSAITGTPVYLLQCPGEYTAYSGDIKLDFSFPENITYDSLDLELVYLQDGVFRKEIKIQGLTLQREVSRGTLTYSCGVVDRAGHYFFRMIVNNKTLAKSRTMTVKWPQFMMSTAPTLTSLTSDLKLKFNNAGASCDPKDSSLVFMLEVIYYGPKRKSSGEIKGALNIHGMHKNKVETELNAVDADLTTVGQSLHIDIVQFSKMRQTFGNFQLTFSCQLFIQIGEYAVVFRTGHKTLGSVISRTARFLVTPNLDSALRPGTPYVQPCKRRGSRGLQVHYEGPRCKARTRDRIRVYRQLADAQPPSPLTLQYVAEKVPKPNRTKVSFSCNLFTSDRYGQTTDRYSASSSSVAVGSLYSSSQYVVGYCFEYVSIDKSSVVSQAKTCIPLDQHTVVDGHWSAWSEWGPCSQTCGLKGQRSRYRACDSPRNTHGGAYCSGLPIQWTRCGPLCKARTTPSYPTFEPDDTACRCGCSMYKLRGRIAAMTPNCRGSSEWKVKVPRRYVVMVTFKVLTLDVSDRRTILKIRDGGDRGNNLLSIEYGRPFGELPVSVVTTSNRLSVVFESPNEKLHGRYGFTVQGFVLEYHVLENNATKLTRPFLLAGFETWQALAVLVVTAVCVSLFVVSVCCACRHQLKTRARRHKKHAVHRALLDPCPSSAHAPATPATSAVTTARLLVSTATAVSGLALPSSPLSSFSSLRSTPDRRGVASADCVDYIDEISSLEMAVVRCADHRPPVEGRDSFPRQLSDPYQQLIPRDTKDLELYDLCTKNSKDNGGSYYLAPAVDLSPLTMQKTALFDDKEDIATSPSIQLEYDDIPEIPGAMLSMPQTAYHLTWADSSLTADSNSRREPVMSTFC